MRKTFLPTFVIALAFIISGETAHAGLVDCGLKMVQSVFVSNPKPIIHELLPLPESHPVKPGDPYDPVGLMTVGEYKGQAMDTHIKRPAKVVYEDNKKILFANFRDGREFHQAHLDKDGIEDVYFRINRFPSGVKGITPAHTLLYFKMKPGAELVLEGARNSPDLSNPNRVSEFVLSVDFAAPHDVKYEMGKSAKPNYMTVMNFSSAADYSLRGADPNFAVEYLKLNLSAKEKRDLIEEAVHRSQERGYNYAYDLLTYNCTTEIFNLLDSTVKYATPVKRYLPSIFKIKDAVAGPSEEGLVQRGLVTKNEHGQLPAIWANFDGILPH